MSSNMLWPTIRAIPSDKFRARKYDFGDAKSKQDVTKLRRVY